MCQVMYSQSHYSYFPYQRNILHQDNKQGIVEPELSSPGEETHTSRDSPSSLPPSTSSQHFQVYNQRSSYQQQQQDSYSPQPQHNNNLPPLVRVDKQIVKGERDKEEEETRRAQYLSANCVIFTYIPGEVSKLVDDHFNKALAQTGDSQAGEHSVPLSARNFPPSFWDSNWVGPPSLPPSNELYPGDHWSSGDPWHNYMAAQMAVTGSSYSAHQMYHSARSYSSLLLHSRREWVEQNYTSPYSGLEGGMQPGGKDLYWF